MQFSPAITFSKPKWLDLSITKTATIWAQGILLYVFSMGILCLILFATPGFLGTDDYYHARISDEMIQQRQLAVDFPWLPQTLLNDEAFVDHHLLFHMYIAPWFHWYGITGAKVATANIVALTLVAIWSLLRYLHVRYAALWTIAFLGLSVPFLYRLLMIRTQGASLLMMIVALHLLFRRRYAWLVGLSFAYVWLYDGFILMPAIAFLYMVATWISDARIEWKPLAFSMAGIALGLLINPYFPENVVFISEHLGAKVDFGSGVRVGNEWYPYTTGALLSNSTGALIALGSVFLRPYFADYKRDRVAGTLMLVALMTLFMVFQSRRFIEYFPAFALLIAAVSWGRGDLSIATSFNLRRWIPLGLVLVLVGLAVPTLRQTYQDAENARDIAYMEGASHWLRENTPDGAMVFQTDWDDFTRLFYYNTHNTYLVGLDPTYLELADKELWDVWVMITEGRISPPSTIIREVFGADYVVSDTRHGDFVDAVRDDDHMQLVYRDAYSYVWQITDGNE